MVAATATTDNLGRRATHAKPCHWSKRRHSNVGGGVTAENTSHNVVPLRTSKMERNSYNLSTVLHLIVHFSFSILYVLSVLCKMYTDVE